MPSFLSKLRALVGASSQAPAPADPKAAFMAEVANILRDTGGVSRLTAKPDAFAFELELESRERTHTLYLENLFVEMRECSHDERVRRIQAIIASNVESDGDETTWEDAQTRLVPILRCSTMFLTTVADVAHLPAIRPFAPFLIETVGLDSESTFQYVTRSALERLRVTPDELFAAAHRTAAACFQDLDVAPYDTTAPYPIWHVAREDSYESSRILMPGWLASFRGKVNGRPVAIVPERAKLIVGGDGDARCLRRLIETAEREYLASPRNISMALYTMDERDRVVPLVLPPSHPLVHEVALGHVKLAMAEYEAQQKILQARLGDDVFVASYKAVRLEDGRPVSRAVWSEGVPTLLPKTDDIAFVVRPREASKEVLTVPWAEVERIAPGILEPDPSLDPPRWRTLRWPDEAMLETFRAATSS